jgi:serine/threonine-protein kinase
MAPEQAAADVMDHRVDIYAWGILAYELLSGAHPFADKLTAQALMVAHLSEAPVSLAERAPGIPPALAELVMQCIEKSPDARPASATEMLEALDTASESRERMSVSVTPVKPRSRRLVPAAAGGILLLALAVYGVAKVGKPSAAAPINSVAVLPFSDDRADSANAYFGEGIADQLMTELGKVPGLRVASRTSSIALGKRRDLDVREIARQLGVSTVVEGTVRRAGGQLRVTAQLTKASDGLALWSDAYEREAKDVFAVQDDITRAIVAALRPELTSGGRTAAQPSPTGTGTKDADAYDLYMRGLYLVERRGPGIIRAVDYFGQAIERDSGYARAYAALAGALQFYPYFSGVPAKQVEARTRDAAARGLELDPALAEPRVALAMADWHAYKWREAEHEFRRAIAADSTSPTAHTQYGRYLQSVGRIPEALAEFRIARRLDPLAGTSSVWLAYCLGQLGDKAGALAESRRARELDPTLITTFTVLAILHLGIGQVNEARAIVANRTAPVPFNGMLSYVYQKTGNAQRAAQIRQSLDAVPDTAWMVHTGRAFAYLGTGDTARVLTEMEAAVEKGEIIAHWVPFVDPMYDPIRQSARFADILRKTGLEGRGLTSR